MILGIDVGTRNLAWCLVKQDQQCEVVGAGVLSLGPPPVAVQATAAVRWLRGVVAAHTEATEDGVGTRLRVICEAQVCQAPTNYAIAHALLATGVTLGDAGEPVSFEFLAPVCKFKTHGPDTKQLLRPLSALRAQAKQRRKSKILKLCAEWRAWDILYPEESKRAPVPWLRVRPDVHAAFAEAKARNKPDDIADAFLIAFQDADKHRKHETQK